MQYVTIQLASHPHAPIGWWPFEECVSNSIIFIAKWYHMWYYLSRNPEGMIVQVGEEDTKTIVPAE
jgi:hypothetical protein